MKRFLLIGVLALLCSPVWAATYYIDETNGDDGNTGLSHAQAFKSLSMATGWPQGTNIYLLCGETWSNQRINVNWSGTSTAQAVIGAYYMNGGVETIGVNGDGKPIIEGVLDNATPANNYPSVGSFLGLVTINGGQYITIQDLHIKNSGQYGIKPASSADNFIIQRCKIENTYMGSVYVPSGCDDGVIEYNYMTNNNNKWIAQGYTGTWGGNIEGGGNPMIVRYNLLDKGYGEGIRVSDNGVVKYNIVIDHQSQGIYVNLAENVEVSYNLVIGTSETTYAGFGDSAWHKGMGINNESTRSYQNMSNIRIHHNIVINGAAGIRFDNSTVSGYTIDYVYINNNLFIDCKYGFDLNNAGVTIDLNNIAVKNNIILAEHADASFINEVGSAVTNWTWGYNQWYGKSDPGSPYTGNTGDSTADPALARAIAWRGLITALSDISMADMIPASPVSGENLGNDYDDALDSASTDFIITDPTLPTDDPVVIVHLDRDNYGWYIGPWLSTGIPFISNLRPSVEQPCGDVTISIDINENAYCRYSTNAAHTTYADMSGNQFTVGENETEHQVVVSPSCDATTTYYFVCQDGDTNDSLRRSLDIVIAAEDDPTPPPISVGLGTGVNVRGGSSGVKFRSNQTLE